MDHEFRGKISRFVQDSEPWWPEHVRAREGSPNVVLVVLDDVGFAQLGCYGSDIDTPVIDGLAAEGLRFSSFHTTALCSPTRSTLMTGRNHHRNGMGRVIELATGFPGYDSRIPLSTPFLPALLTPLGYAAWAVGKWHLTPEEEIHLGAPRIRWPLARGFERFYGFMDGETHQYAPSLYCDNAQIDPPRSDGYHLSEDLVDQSIKLVKDLRSADGSKPFYLYLAFGACHSPHHVWPGWIEQHRGRFDEGWDVLRERTFARQLADGLLPVTTQLSERPEWVPAWDSLKPDVQRLYARFMEAFAGYLSHADAQLGRLLSALEETGDRDNTMVIVLSDNGASSEGGPFGSMNDNRSWNLAPSSLQESLAKLDLIGGPLLHNNYPWGWTVAGNTPFRRWKREVHEGGVADPLVISWPAGLPRGEVRDHYVHSVDLLPTILEACGAPPAEDIDGRSFLTSARDATVPSERHVQYYEMFGCRALWRDGWKAVSYHPIQAPEPGLENAPWELYDTRVDPSECHDLALEQPDLLAELVELWWSEAERNQVLPVDNRPLSDLVFTRPHPVPERQSYTFWPDTSMVGDSVMVSVRNRSHTITAHVTDATHGVLLQQGSVLGGWVVFLDSGRLSWVHSYLSVSEDRATSEVLDLSGDHELAVRFTRTYSHEGTIELLLDGAVVGGCDVPRFTPNRFTITGAGQWCGRAGGSPVCADAGAGVPVDGVLHRVVVDVEGSAWFDPVLEAQRAIMRQ